MAEQIPGILQPADDKADMLFEFNSNEKLFNIGSHLN